MQKVEAGTDVPRGLCVVRAEGEGADFCKIMVGSQGLQWGWLKGEVRHSGLREETD